MRKLKNLSKNEQAEILEVFPGVLNVICDIEPYSYNQTSVSIFDHWLSEEEAIKLLVNVPSEEQHRRDDAFKRFNYFLVESTECYKFTLKGMRKERIQLKRFTSKESALDCINPDTWPFFWVIIPEYKVVYGQGYDDTAYFWHISDTIPKPLEALVNKRGLHVL
ncbi:hypothetical protein [Microbulbifer hydrolyticus]|uniref:Uncharacterized protein n=1 Tax=Microbulbifer hydrolyticus TaxID=48074 RepID=A0A6P1T8V2_9GAMM|nr:hypothetical protein [Microbulbifer hydrolyticus]MBB5210264.1 hypothetical protein [Microbulbifer hydrolyticus]QHQ39234.1 hypothetical protein GTQ55_09710 [Microbulbifer hydrolyticus]